MDVLASEAHGRVGKQAEELLSQWAREAHRGGPEVQGIPTGLKVRRLRAAIDTSVARSYAEAVMLTLGATAGKLLPFSRWAQEEAERQQEDADDAGQRMPDPAPVPPVPPQAALSEEMLATLEERRTEAAARRRRKQDEARAAAAQPELQLRQGADAQPQERSEDEEEEEEAFFGS